MAEASGSQMSQPRLTGTKKRRVMPSELVGKFRSKADFIKFFKEGCQLYVPPERYINKDFLKQVMGDIGINLELRYEDVPTWLKRVYHRYDFQMSVNYFYQLPDPVLGVHRHYGTDQIRKGTHFVNSSRYSNPTLDALLDSGAGEPDAAKRTAAYNEIQQILANDMPVVNLFELEFLVVYNNKLKGAYDSAMGAYGSFREAYLDD